MDTTKLVRLRALHFGVGAAASLSVVPLSVFAAGPQPEGAVCVYRYSQYRGASTCFNGDQPVLGTWNNRISSLRVRDGVTVTLYLGEQYQRASTSFSTDALSLGGVGFDNATSSIRIRSQGTAPPPPPPPPPPPAPPPPASSDAQVSSVELGQSHVFAVGDNKMALVGGKAALVKVNVTTARPEQAKPTATLRVLRNGAVLRELTMTAPSGALPAVVPTVPSFADSYTVTVPGDLVQRGVQLSVQLDNGRAATVVNPVVEGDNRVTVVSVPVVIGGTSGQVVADADPYVAARMPANVSYRVRAPFVSQRVTSLPSSEAAWSTAFRTLLPELDALHANESAGDATYYYGFVPKRTFGLAGLGYRPGNAAIGFDVPTSPTAVKEVMVHEIGHNFSLPHAPCGGPASPDPNFPYPNGQLGGNGRFIWGYDAGTRRFVDPRSTTVHDIMTYCDGDTFSDYNYRNMQVYLDPSVAAVADAAMSAAAQSRASRLAPASSPPQELLMVGGQIDAAGNVTLSPMKALIGVPTVARGGTHTLRLVTEAGIVNHAFTLKELDHDPSVKHFLFTIPHPGTVRSLSVLRGGAPATDPGTQRSGSSAPAAAAGGVSLPVKTSGSASAGAPAQWNRDTATAMARQGVQLVERNGEVRLNWNHAEHPFVTLVHVGPQRTVIGQDLEGGSASLPSQGLPAGGHWELSFSDGVNAIRMQLQRQ